QAASTTYVATAARGVGALEGIPPPDAEKARGDRPGTIPRGPSSLDRDVSSGGDGRVVVVGRRDLLEADADLLGDAGLLHGDAVEGVADLHGPLVVRDQDELRGLAHL